jgi:aldose sugar dehydrogenase
LWDSENGPGNSDEINLVKPGFNSGWQQVMGLAFDIEEFHPSDLVTFDGKGHYEEPKLVWINTVGPIALIFLNSDKLGLQYKNDMFVGDVHLGRIYHFKLTSDRTDLILPDSLSDRVIPNLSSPGLEEIVFGEGFTGISDLTVGPDGYLYVVSIEQEKVFRIIPT